MTTTELHIASGDDDVDEVQRLIDENVDVNCVSAAGLTALHVAAGEGADRAIDLLCKAKADVNALTLFGKETAVHRAACEGHKSCVLRLVSAKANIDALSSEGFSALHEACREGNADTVQLLLEQGAAVNLVSITGLSPLHVAVRYESLDCVKLLLSSGANIYCEDRDGESPAELADRSSNAEQGEAMLKALGAWKSRLILNCLLEFIPRLQSRISKETGMALVEPLRTVDHPRFRKLFTMQEFKSLVTLLKIKDARLAAVTEADLDDDSWRIKSHGVWVNTRRVFASSLEPARAGGGRPNPSEEEVRAAAAAQLARDLVLAVLRAADPAAAPADPAA